MTSILPTLAITTAIPATRGTIFQIRESNPRNLTLQANFVYGSAGTTVDAYVQMSLDNGVTWCDVANFHFTTASARKVFNLSSLTPVTTQATPSDGALASNTAVDGLFGPLLCVKYVTTGTYAGGTTLTVDAQSTRIVPSPNE